MEHAYDLQDVFASPSCMHNTLASPVGAADQVESDH
jgi:hypothetical protein